MNRGPRQREGTDTRWYHVPVIWVGIVALAGSVLGCVVTVMTALQQDGTAMHSVAPGGTFGLPPLEARANDDRPR
ncbi:MAG: hypothetical protein U5K43_06460 [Halofilum sp. (in: g-proteobacteria)]|nr:hypothetical protein [Halofilum sp. (in: g-proteobacteria)]